MSRRFWEARLGPQRRVLLGCEVKQSLSASWAREAPLDLPHGPCSFILSGALLGSWVWPGLGPASEALPWRALPARAGAGMGQAWNTWPISWGDEGCTGAEGSLTLQGDLGAPLVLKAEEAGGQGERGMEASKGEVMVADTAAT